jgi:hypothetical protein
MGKKAGQEKVQGLSAMSTAQRVRVIRDVFAALYASNWVSESDLMVGEEA